MDKSYKDRILDNKETDLRYRQQIDETNHQNHRMVWILAAQTLIFAALPLKFLSEDDATILVPLLSCVIIWVGCCISLSSIYSMMVGEFSIGNILDGWTECKNKNKLDKIEHFVIAVPPLVMKSKLSFLSLYSFAPKIFFSAWTTILVIYFSHYNVIDISFTTISQTSFCFFIILCEIMIVCKLYCYYKEKQILDKRCNTTKLQSVYNINNLKVSKDKHRNRQEDIFKLHVVCLAALFSVIVLRELTKHAREKAA